LGVGSTASSEAFRIHLSGKSDLPELCCTALVHIPTPSRQDTLPGWAGADGTGNGFHVSVGLQPKPLISAVGELSRLEPPSLLRAPLMKRTAYYQEAWRLQLTFVTTTSFSSSL